MTMTVGLSTPLVRVIMLEWFQQAGTFSIGIPGCIYVFIRFKWTRSSKGDVLTDAINSAVRGVCQGRFS